MGRKMLKHVPILSVTAVFSQQCSSLCGFLFISPSERVPPMKLPCPAQSHMGHISNRAKVFIV